VNGLGGACKAGKSRCHEDDLGEKDVLGGKVERPVKLRLWDNVGNTLQNQSWGREHGSESYPAPKNVKGHVTTTSPTCGKKTQGGTRASKKNTASGNELSRSGGRLWAVAK